jgi:glycosyltransferase involved in cell wall biosynthesis
MRPATARVEPPGVGGAGPDAGSRLRVAVLCDYREEGWPSMDLVAEMLTGQLEARHASSVAVRTVCPRMISRARRLPGLDASPHARNADRLWSRFVDYPRHVRRVVPEADVFHLVDHSYSHLLHHLPPGRTVVTCHDLDTFRCLLEPSRDPRSALFRAMARRILEGFRLAARVVCVSATTRDELLAHGLLPEHRLHVVHNGVHPSCSPVPSAEGDRALERRIGAPEPGRAELLHVGSTIQRKRIDVLLSVVAEVARERPDVRLIRVGGPLTAEQRGLATRLGIEGRVLELPFLSRPELAALYRRAALVLQTSEAEGFGLPVAEALACGTPVVGSDLPVLREVGGDAVTYCRVGAVEEWCRSIVNLLVERAERPELWLRRRGEAIEQATRFSWAANADRMVSLYQEVARHPLPPGSSESNRPE